MSILQGFSFKGLLAKKDLLPRMLVAFSLALLTFLVAMRSRSAPLYLDGNHTDGWVFKYVGYMMTKGFMPYKDTFDHKGPLLYILNYLGCSIRTARGIWIFEAISLLFAHIFSYKTFRLFIGRFFAIFGVIVLWSFYMIAMEGNMTESFALPFLMISLFIFTDYFYNGTVNRRRLFALGASFGCTVLLRVNLCSLWAVLCVAVLVKTVSENRTFWYKNIFYFLRWFIFGMAVIVLPVFIWLIVRGAFNAFVEDYLLFNLAYSSENSRAGLTKKLLAYTTFFSLKEILASVFILILAIYKKRRFFDITFTIFVILSVIVTGISGQTYGHYRLTFMPCVLYPLALLLRAVAPGFKKNGFELLLSASLTFVLFYVAVEPWKSNVNHIINRSRDHSAGKKHVAEWILKTSDIIQKNTSEDDRITVFSNKDIIYVWSKRLSASKYSYQFPLGTVKPAIMDEYFSEIEQNLPKIIVIDKPRFANERMSDFIQQHEYTLIYEKPDVRVYKLTEALQKQ